MASAILKKNSSRTFLNRITDPLRGSIGSLNVSAKGDSRSLEKSDRTLRSPFLPLQISSATAERRRVICGSGSFQTTQRSVICAHGLDCCNSLHSRHVSMLPRMSRSHMPLFSRVNNGLKPCSTPEILVATRTIVTFPPRVQYEIPCYICNDKLKSGYPLLRHFKTKHTLVHTKASRLKMVCCCGSSFVELEKFNLHQSTCPCVKWYKPPKGFVKVTTDGSCNLDGPKLCGSGGSLRDSDGYPSVMFSEPLGLGNAPLAELRAFNRGLGIVCVGKHRKVIHELDSEVIIGALKKAVKNQIEGDPFDHILQRPGNETYEHLLLHAKNVLERADFEFQVTPIYREANRVADELAKLGKRENKFKIHSFDLMKNSKSESYSKITELIEDDMEDGDDE